MQTPGVMAGAVDLSALAAKAETSRAAGGAPAPASGDGAVVDVVDATFETEVIERSARGLVIVELWAGWSPESAQLSPMLAAMAQRAGGMWTLARVDVDASPGIAQAFGAQSVPMVVALAGGQPVSAFNGLQPEAQIQGWIDEIVSKVGGGAPAPAAEPEDPRMVAAEQLMNDGDVDGALAVYRTILESEPNHPEARATVRNLEFIMRAQAHDPSIVELAAPGDIDAQFAAADVLLLSQQNEAAFDRILAVVRSTFGDDKDRARARLLELFELFDPADPLVVAARRKLAVALY